MLPLMSNPFHLLLQIYKDRIRIERTPIFVPDPTQFLHLYNPFNSCTNRHQHNCSPIENRHGPIFLPPSLSGGLDDVMFMHFRLLALLPSLSDS
ncbi:Uncharacterised protein [uncultured archaeon]|nr:Uncharacterised protein [uncultured archaeon]